MTSEKKLQNLIDVKLTLARKYDRLSNHAGSKKKRFKFQNRANRYRRQIERLKTMG